MRRGEEVQFTNEKPWLLIFTSGGALALSREHYRMRDSLDSLIRVSIMNQVWSSNLSNLSISPSCCLNRRCLLLLIPLIPLLPLHLSSSPPSPPSRPSHPSPPSPPNHPSCEIEIAWERVYPCVVTPVRWWRDDDVIWHKSRHKVCH